MKNLYNETIILNEKEFKKGKNIVKNLIRQSDGK